MGLRIRRPELDASSEIRFLTDEMLAGLGRWLRVIGYDTLQFVHGNDEEAIRLAFAEGRVVLTRDRRLACEWWIDGCYLVRSTRPLEQLKEIVERFGLRWRERMFDRCTRCNRVLAPVESGCRPDGVPQSVFARRLELRRCPECRRVYWEGSHTQRMRAALEQILGTD